MNRYRLTAPVVVAGENPFRDPALVERTCHISFDAVGKNIQAMDDLFKLDLHRFNAGMYRHVMKLSLKDMWEQAERALPSAFKSMSPRQYHTWRVVAFGLLLLEPFWSIETINGYIGQLVAAHDAGKRDTTESVDAMLHEIVRILIEVIRARRISNGHDYAIRDIDGEHILYIIPSLVLPAIEEYALRYQSSLPMSVESIRRTLREADARGRICAGYRVNVRMAGSKNPKHAIGLHLEQIANEMDIPVEYWLMGAMQDVTKL